jgi:thioredoxin reductase
VRLLEASGWQMPPPKSLPTGKDLVDQYLRTFAELPAIQSHIHLNARVVAVSRLNVDKMKDSRRDDAPFILHVVYGNGEEALIEARAVIDASGTWHQPNPIGSSGLPAVGEKRNSQHIFYGIPDVRDAYRFRYANKRVMVVGSGHSAINALLELIELKQEFSETTITWVMRGTSLTRVYGGGEEDALPARGRLGTRIQAHVDAGTIEILSPFRIRELMANERGIRVIGETSNGAKSLQVDELIAATGARPDLEMLRELRLDLDPSLESTRPLAPMIDPNIHSCGTVRPHGEAELRQPEKNFYIVGMKSYGRAPTFLLATGYEQVRSVVAALVGDWEAAREVQLNLPETGVCNSNLDGDGDSCCSTSSASVSQPALLSIANIPVNGALLQPVGVQQVALQPEARACGCADTCCDDGIRSTTCGCDSTCCS